MDLELACVVCNWSRDFWEWIGFGGIGAAAAAAAAAVSDFVDTGVGRGPARPEDRQEDDPLTASARAIDRAVSALEDTFSPPPIQDVESVDDTLLSRPTRYADSAGNPYWPGLSVIPDSEMVYTTDDYPPREVPVDPLSGEPVWSLGRSPDDASSYSVERG